MAHKKYFVVVELNRTGYLIGSYKLFEEAEVDFKKIYSLSTSYSFFDSDKMNKKLTKYRKYQIKSNLYFEGHCHKMTTNGVISVYLCEVGNTITSIEYFIKNREFQNMLFLED